MPRTTAKDKRNFGAEGPLAGWDITISADQHSKQEVLDFLTSYGKKWVFQLEKGETTGYEHYQCRISLMKKLRFSTIKTRIAAGDFFGHWTPTTNAVHLGNNFNYVMKEETKIAGPWCDTDEIKVETTQLLMFNKLELRPYQKFIYEEAQKFDMRKIHLIYDQIGNVGKSIFGEFMEHQGLAEEIPPFRMMDDIFQWVCTRPIKPCYFVDMPRGMKKDRLGDFYSGIEIIKNGVAYDKRYSAKKIRFNRPQIFLFTNTLPNFDLMSKDRWVICEMQPDYSLKFKNCFDDDEVITDSDSSWVED